MPDQSPALDVLTCTYGEALGIYLYAHRQIDDPRDVGQAEIVRGKENSSSASADTAFIAYITRGANSERRYWEIAAEPVEFSFVLQQTLAHYATGLVDAQVDAAKAEMEAMRAAHLLAQEKSLAKATQGADDTWSASSDCDD